MNAKVFVINVPYGQYVYAATCEEELSDEVNKMAEVLWGDITVSQIKDVTICVPHTPYCLGGYAE